MSTYYGWARCPGTCGEWVQGAKGGIPFLIDCPVDRFVEVKTHFNKHQANMDSSGRRDTWQLPQRKIKTEQALELLANRFGFAGKGKVSFCSELSVGKGMASSTADLSAVMAAVLTSFDISWEPEDLARIALTIEPSDPVMFPGITEFAHLDGKYVRKLGENIPAQLLALDWGGTLDTQCFNARSDLSAHYRKNELLIRKALAVFYEGMDNFDLEKLAYAGTISAQCNQEINPKPYMQELNHHVRGQGGLGMVTAHSGTLLAGVFPPTLSQIKKEEILENARLRFNPVRIEWMETGNGGIQTMPTQRGGANAWRKLTPSSGEIRQSKIY